MSKKPKMSMQETTNTMSQPQWLMRHGQSIMNNASRQMGRKGDPTWVPFSSESEAGLSGIYDQAQMGVPGIDQAFDEWQSTLGGEYLYGGQGFDRMAEAVGNRVVPQVTSAFNTANRMGGGAGQGELATRMADALMPYQQAERDRMFRAVSQAPMMQQVAYDPYVRMRGVGLERENKQLEEQNDRRNRLQHYLNAYAAVSPYHTMGTNQQPVYSGGGGLGSMLGAGLSIAGMAMGGPAGMAMGAAGGLLGNSGGGMSVGSQYRAANPSPYRYLY